MKLKRTGSVWINHGLWYYAVQLPGEKSRRQVPLRAPGAKHTLKADRPRKMAEAAAARYWEEHTRQTARHEPSGATVADLCAAWDVHCREYYKDPANAILGVRMFRELYGSAAVAELTHTDMLRLRDALVRSGVSRTTVNARLWRVKFMLGWALDEALIPAAVKAELTQVKGVKRGRSAAPERAPVRPVDDATVAATVEHMMPNTADMVRVHRLTGMRPCELCALRWSLVDRSRLPWVYRVPAEANKNSWRGEFGMPRVVCIGPKARAVLERHRNGGDVPFSPIRAQWRNTSRTGGRPASRPCTASEKTRRTPPAFWASGGRRTHTRRQSPPPVAAPESSRGARTGCGTPSARRCAGRSASTRRGRFLDTRAADASRTCTPSTRWRRRWFAVPALPSRPSDESSNLRNLNFGSARFHVLAILPSRWQVLTAATMASGRERPLSLSGTVCGASWAADAGLLCLAANAAPARRDERTTLKARRNAALKNQSVGRFSAGGCSTSTASGSISTASFMPPNFCQT